MAKAKTVTKKTVTKTEIESTGLHLVTHTDMNTFDSNIKTFSDEKEARKHFEKSVSVVNPEEVKLPEGCKNYFANGTLITLTKK